MKLKKIIFILLSLFFIGMFNFMCFDGAKNVSEVLKSKNKAVEIEATITNSEKYIETDEGMERDYWHAKVSYVYDGTEYNDVFYKRMDEEPEIGKLVLVKINPDVPDKILPDALEFGLSMFISPIFLSVISVAVFLIVQYLLGSKIKAQLLSKIIAVLVALTVLIVESLAFYGMYASFVFTVFSLIATCALLFAFVYTLIAGKQKQHN